MKVTEGAPGEWRSNEGGVEQPGRMEVCRGEARSDYDASTWGQASVFSVLKGRWLSDAQEAERLIEKSFKNVLPDLKLESSESAHKSDGLLRRLAGILARIQEKHHPSWIW